jgi:hypothetical protein
MQDVFGSELRNTLFVHIVRVLLACGVVVYCWLTISALTRKPTSVWRAVRKAVYAAWLAVLYMLIRSLNPVPYLPAAGFLAAVLIVFALWDRFVSRADESPHRS